MGYPRACARQVDDLANGRIDGVEEFNSQAGSTAFIPTSGIAVLGVSLVLEANVECHRLRNSATARLRTSSHGMPSDSPAITRQARLSISAAQAASTSALFSAPASSRLAKSGYVSSFVDGQPQGLTKKVLRSGRHVAILDSAVQPNKRLHQAAAYFSCSRWVSRDR